MVPKRNFFGGQIERAIAIVLVKAVLNHLVVAVQQNPTKANNKNFKHVQQIDKNGKYSGLTKPNRSPEPC